MPRAKAPDAFPHRVKPPGSVGRERPLGCDELNLKMHAGGGGRQRRIVYRLRVVASSLRLVIGRVRAGQESQRLQSTNCMA